MAYDQDILDEPKVDDTPDQKEGPGPALSEENRKKLDAIVLKMQQNKESDQNIQTVVNDFKTKYSSATNQFAAAHQNAQQQLQTELTSNKDIIPSIVKKQKTNNLISQGQAAFAMQPRSDMPQTAVQQLGQHLAGPVAPVTVSDQEVEDYDKSIATNDQSARGFLHQVQEHKPEKKKAIQSAMYIADASSRVNDDKKAQEVLGNAGKINSGELTYNVNTGHLQKPEGVWESLKTGLKSKNQSFADYNLFSNLSPKDAITELEKRRSSYNPDEPTPIPEGAASGLAEGLSSQPLKGLVAGKVAGGVTAIIPGAEEFAPAADQLVTAAVSGNDFKKITYANALQKYYNELRNQGASPEEAYDKANSQAKDESKVDAIAGGAMMLAGGRIGSIEVPRFSLSNGFKEALKTGIKQTIKGVGEAGAVGALQGIAQDAKNKLADLKGIQRDESGRDIGEAMESGALFTLGMAVLAKGAGSLTKATKNGILMGLAKVAPKKIDEELGHQIMDGTITPDEAKEAKTTIQDFQTTNASIPDNVTDEAKLKIQDKIARRGELEKQLETADKAYHPDIKEKIKAINEDILELSKDKKPRGEKDILDQEPNGEQQNVPRGTFVPNQEYVQPESAFRTLDYGENKGQEENKPAQDKIENEILEDKPIGNTGDKLSTFIQRVIPAFQGMLKDAEHNTVLVTHSSVIKALRVWEDMGRPDVNSIDIKDFARRYVDLKPEKEGEVAAFKGDNGKDIKVVRHGETEDNVASEFRTNDTPLTDKGIAQARAAGQNIMKATGGQVPKIVTSDLPRAIHTSDVIRQQLQQTKGGLNQGDMVISKHFEGPQQVRSVSEDGKSVYIEGQDHHVHEIPIEDITLKIKNNASTVRGDKGQIQEGGNAPEGRQETRSDDLQQHPEETPVNAETEQQAGGDGGKITGIAQRVQEQLGLRKYEKGEGWTPEEAFAFGKAAIAQGADPEKAMTDPHYANLDLDQRLAIAQAHNYTLHNDIVKAENDHGIESEQYKDAVKKQDDYLKLVQPLKTESSRAFTAQQGGIDLDTGSFTSVKKVVEKKTGGPLTKEQSDKVLELTNKNKDLQSKVSDLENQLKNSIDETLKTEPASKSSKQIKKTAQEIASFIRKGKISRPDAFSAATPASLVWDAMIEISAKTVEAGGTIAQAIADGIEHMKKSDWYNGLTEDKKKNATNAFTEYIEDKAVDKKEMANIRRMEKELSDLESGVAKQKDPKRALSDREKELQDQIFEAKKNLGLIKSRPVKEPKIKLTEEQNKLGRLQKQLDDLLAGNVKDKPKISEDSPEAKAIKDQIFEAKKNLGLIKPKQELDSIEDFEKERDELATKFVDKKGNKFTPEEASDLWDYMKRNYLDKNVNFRDAIVQVANDTGLSFEQISNAIVTPKNKRISDAMWKKRYDLEKNRQATQRYVDSQGQNEKINLFKKIANSVREITVFGHGGVFVGTHAGMTLMDLPRAKHTIKSFFNAYKLAYGKDAYYQKSMEELKASPNYKLAQRSGLKNNPDIINNDAEIIAPIFGRISESGKRGFNAIKILRQDLFDAHYNALSGEEKTDPNAAVAIAKIVNNATGASNLKIPDWVNEVTFAGGMEVSRWGKLTRNPMTATKTALTALFKPQSVSIEDRVFAKVWAKRVGTQLASYLGLLTVNAAIQNSLTDDPKKKVNLLDPTKSDWLKMKIGDTTFDFTSGMLSTLHFIESIAYQGVSGKPVYKDESLPKSFAETGYKYALGKLSPFYGDVVEAATRHDYNGNTLPWSDAKPLHKFNHKMTWGEYITSKSPLPVAEGFKTFYEEAHEQGVDKDDLDNILTGLKYGLISGTTGFKAYETPQKQTGGSTEGGGASGSFKITEYK